MYKEPKNESEYEAELKNAPVAVVYLTATWCGPCRAIAPVFTNISNAPENSKITFFKVDVDALKKLPVCESLQGVPTFIAYRNGEEQERFSGANKVALENMVKKLL
ncbi:hypothetical protein DDB_G0287227 [Dictyostelium discoideum AX4]|uniref:Putative thioredoxin-5 n=1 Tax=Dictyostelium discoideum TaxID=44689 RepID=THIO5_DICDI|nr:hypothetical protein DDB_G0287227 [Dictyostelium discoideum AX4]Q54KN7.1 RecName: Full=Putative thioredoxin-5; Short=Trx-5 [Dictyostelium discoideum]EAL63815.1 hypothetical protein DDB_G0287227 [Dictyostelium discoideum AX4]|eukprot:XP_637320.1 hypothetical protein DDB_G0287227 [Dictyostelium discoideum AX4]